MSFLGVYNNLSDLQIAYPLATNGDYAFVYYVNEGVLSLQIYVYQGSPNDVWVLNKTETIVLTEGQLKAINFNQLPNLAITNVNNQVLSYKQGVGFFKSTLNSIADTFKNIFITKENATIDFPINPTFSLKETNTNTEAQFSATNQTIKIGAGDGTVNKLYFEGKNSTNLQELKAKFGDQYFDVVTTLLGDGRYAYKLQDIVRVQSASDLPLPINGLHILENKNYVIEGTLVLSNPIAMPSTGFARITSANFGFIFYLGTDAIFKNNILSLSSAILELQNLVLISPNGSIYNLQGTVSGLIYHSASVVIAQAKALGNINTMGLTYNLGIINNFCKGLRLTSVDSATISNNYINRVGTNAAMLSYNFLTTPFVVSDNILALTSIITGQASGATAILEIDDNIGAGGDLYIRNITGTFINGEIISCNRGGSASVNGTLKENPQIIIDGQHGAIKLSGNFPYGASNMPVLNALSSSSGNLILDGENFTPNGGNLYVSTSRNQEDLDVNVYGGNIKASTSVAQNLITNNTATTTFASNPATIVLDAAVVYTGDGVGERFFKMETVASFNSTTDIITVGFNHGLSNGFQVYFRNNGGALPTGILLGKKYFVINATTTTYQISESFNGSPVDFLTNGTGTSYYLHRRGASKSGIVVNLGSTVDVRIDGLVSMNALINSANTYTPVIYRLNTDFTETLITNNCGRIALATGTAATTAGSVPISYLLRNFDTNQGLFIRIQNLTATNNIQVTNLACNFVKA